MASLDAGLNQSEDGLNGASMPCLGRKCINNSSKSTQSNNSEFLFQLFRAVLMTIYLIIRKLLDVSNFIFFVL